MSAFLSPFFGAGAQIFSNSGVPLAGGKIYTYQAGTTSPQATYTDPSQTIANANPIILDSSGRVPGEIWLIGGAQYKLVLTDSTGVPVGYTYDNISGVNDASYPQVTVSEWNLGSTPTFVNSTTFTVPGDQRSTYQVNRRVQCTVTAGTATGTITNSTFGAGVTTIVATYDSTSLDSGLSTVKYSILSATPTSLPGTVLSAFTLQNQTPTAGTTGGTASAFTLTPSPAITAYAANQEFDVTFNATNTGGATININGLGALALVKAAAGGTYTPVTGGEVVNNWRSKVTVLAGLTQALVRDPTPTAGGATGGGTDAAFYEADVVITNDWEIGQQAMLSGVTVTIANPAVFSLASHGFVAEQQVRLKTTGALPTGLDTNSVYYVLSAGLTSSQFQVSTTLNGSPVATSGSQSGTHSVGKLKNAFTPGNVSVATGKVVTVPTGSIWTTT